MVFSLSNLIFVCVMFKTMFDMHMFSRLLNEWN